MITIKSIKAWIRKEEKRLNQRTLSQTTAQELASLEGSLLTIKKLKVYINAQNEFQN